MWINSPFYALIVSIKHSWSFWNDMWFSDSYNLTIWFKMAAYASKWLKMSLCVCLCVCVFGSVPTFQSYGGEREETLITVWSPARVKTNSLGSLPMKTCQLSTTGIIIGFFSPKGNAPKWHNFHTSKAILETETINLKRSTTLRPTDQMNASTSLKNESER